MTPTRFEVLKRCSEAGAGFQPLGPDWFAIYWLRDSGYVEKVRHRPHSLTPRFVLTAAGRRFLSTERMEIS